MDLVRILSDRNCWY